MIVQSLKQAKEKQKTIQVTFLKVFLTGSAAAGKTSFSHLLLKKKMNKSHESTDLVCASHVVSVQKAAFHDMSATENKEITWVEFNPSLEIHYLRSLLVSSDSSDSNSSNSSSEKDDQTELVTEESSGTGNKVHDTTFLQKSIIFFWYVIGWFIPSFLYPVNQPIEPPTLNDDKSKVATAAAVNATSDVLHEKEINSENLSSFKYILQDSLISDPGLFVYMEGKKLNIITILDTGGQPQYIHLLPAINIHPTVNFVIHDLSKNLNDQVQVEYNKNGKQVVFPYPLEYSYLDMIKLLMSVANDSADKDTSYGQELKLNTIEGADNDSCLCLLGTHKDQVNDEVIENTATTLTTLVKDMKCKAPVWRNKDETVLFTVDNTTAGSEKEDYIASVMRKNIEDVAASRDVYEVPITWMLLELEIKKFCEQKSKAFISFEQCLELARNGGLISSDEEMKKALNYHHFLGVLLYFKDIKGLCNYIIIDHQWWFDKLSRIICLTFHGSHNHDAVDKLKFQGIFSRKLLHHIPWDKDDIEKEYFISLLYHMKIIACLDMENETYFIPFVLPTYKPKEIETLNQFGNIQGEPLLVQFHSGLLPRGFFCSLVVHLLRLDEWELHNPKDWKEHRIFNNLITFCLPNAFSLLLFDKINYLELQIRHKAKGFQSLIHYNTYQNLVPVLRKVCKHLLFDIKRLRCGFLCSCKKGISKDHIAFLPDNISDLPKKISSERFATCVRDSAYIVKITNSHKLWFSQLPLSSDNTGMYKCYMTTQC